MLSDEFFLISFRLYSFSHTQICVVVIASILIAPELLALVCHLGEQHAQKAVHAVPEHIRFESLVRFLLHESKHLDARAAQILVPHVVELPFGQACENLGALLSL